jgi:guanine deaminase
MPGFIDTHTHYPQTEIIGSYGKQLIDWLNGYTFPVEEHFNNINYASRVADMFIKEVLRNGTTTCMTFGTVNPASVDAIFSAASKYNMRLIAGKVLMNRNAPPGICDSIHSARHDCESLIEKWHKYNRNIYALTPRFAITCDMEELSLVGDLYNKYPDTFIQTHLAENVSEIKMTMKLFPDCSDYLNVYEKAGIVTDRTIFAHCIHLSDSEFERIHSAGSVIAHCPTSNLFLGSGLFNMSKSNSYTEKTIIATDVGAGTSFSLLKTLSDAYKVQQINGYPMNAFESYYSLTIR